MNLCYWSKKRNPYNGAYLVHSSTAKQPTESEPHHKTEQVRKAWKEGKPEGESRVEVYGYVHWTTGEGEAVFVGGEKEGRLHREDKSALGLFRKGFPPSLSLSLSLSLMLNRASRA